MYTEVRYAKKSCLSLKHTASVFRLKRDYKNLPSTEYVENLCQYLGDARSKTMLTAEDLSLVLTNLINITNNEIPETSQLANQTSLPINQTNQLANQTSQPANQTNQLANQTSQTTNQTELDHINAEQMSDYNLDKHIAVVWMDEKENVLTWYLGVVNSVSPDSINVTYYHRRDKQGTSWTFPEDDDSDPVQTPRSHVIFREITVGYMQTRVIRCAIDKKQ